ncbi:hypothetical protein TOTORO_02440 [Serratia phage vB_SmaS-Totoro]|nr:hypothetical protein TOTORO_02440 [Serratia phage vB_SmaS-Totoro]
MAVLNTPSLSMRGIWSLKAPWTADHTLLYTCIALRKFKEIISIDGVDIFKVHYQPRGLTQDQYQKDLAAGATMCVLSSDAGAVIQVPDTYIESYPGIAMSNYGIAVLSAMIGPLPLNISFDFLIDQVKNVITDTIGVEPTVNLDHIPTNTAISPQDADALEAARQAAIKNRTSTYAQLLAEQQANASLRQTIVELQKLLAKK